MLADVAFESEMTDEHGDLSGPLKILEDSSRLGAELNRLSEPMGDRESSRVKSSQVKSSQVKHYRRPSKASIQIFNPALPILVNTPRIVFISSESSRKSSSETSLSQWRPSLAIEYARMTSL